MNEWQRNLVHGTMPLNILAVLSSGPRHPYAIRQALIEGTQSQLVPSEGTIYPLLTRLQKRGLVTSELQPGRGKQLRRVYALTTKGRQELRAGVEAWSGFSRRMEALVRSAEIS